MKGIHLSQKEKILLGVLLISLIGVSILAGYFFTQYATVKGRYETLQTQYNSLQNELTSLENKELDLIEQLKTAEEDEIPELQVELEKIREEKKELKNRIAELEKQLDEYRKLYIREFRLTEIPWSSRSGSIYYGDYARRTNIVRFWSYTSGTYTWDGNFRDTTIGELKFDMHLEVPHNVLIELKQDDITVIQIQISLKDQWETFKITWNCKHNKFSYYRNGYLVEFNRTFIDDISNINTLSLSRSAYQANLLVDFKYLEGTYIKPEAPEV